MDQADADGAADLRICRAQVAMLVVRQGLVLRLIGYRVRDRVRVSTVLCNQHGEGEKQRKKKAGRLHDGRHLNKAEVARQALLQSAT